MKNHLRELENFFNVITILGLLLLFIDYFTPMRVSPFITGKILFVMTTISLICSIFFYILVNGHKFWVKKAYWLKFSILFLLFAILFHDLIVTWPTFTAYISFFLPLDNFWYIMILMSIGIGIISYYFSRKEIEDSIYSSKIIEDKLRIQEYISFSSKFPKISRLPFLGSISREFYKRNAIYGVLIIAIVFLFIFVRLPYLDISFTGEHSMKYNAYVGPAKIMYEKENPFINQLIYRSDPIENPYGKYTEFKNLPIMEWGLMSTYLIFPNNSFELNTRLFTLFVGVLTIVAIYSFFRMYLTRFHAIIITFLGSINPIISFIFFVTVEDSILLLCTFLSLIFLKLFERNEDYTKLYWAGLFFGIGISAKESIFFWLMPMSFFTLLYMKKNFLSFLKNATIYYILSVLPILTVFTSIYFLPSSVYLGLFLFFLWVVFYFLLFQFINRKHNAFGNYLRIIWSHRITVILLILSATIAVVVFLYLTEKLLYSTEFFTDSHLILNWKFYSYMVQDQFMKYMGEPLFYLAIIGVFIIPFSRCRDEKAVSVIFVGGALIYWILVSKAIFFHLYYQAIIMMSFIVLASTVIVRLKEFYQAKYLKLCVILLIITIVYIPSFYNNVDRLQKENTKYLIDVGQYVKSISDPNDIVVLSGNKHSSMSIISLYMERASFTPEKLYNITNDRPDFSLANLGIKYILVYDESEFDTINNIINCDNIDFLGHHLKRTELILQRLNENDKTYKEPSCEIIYDIRKHISFDTEISRTKIFTVVD